MRRLLPALFLSSFLVQTLLAEESVEKAGLSEFNKYLRDYATSKTRPRQSAEGVRALAASDPDLAKSPYVKDLVILILNDLIFLDQSGWQYESKPAPFSTPGFPNLNSQGRIRPPITSTYEGQSSLSPNVAARTQSIESRLKVLEKHFLTPQGQTFSIPIRSAFFCAIAPEIGKRFEKKRTGHVLNLSLEVASSDRDGIRAYERVFHMGQGYLADKSHTVIVRGYKKPAKEGDVITIDAVRYESGGKLDPRVVEFVVFENSAPIDTKRFASFSIPASRKNEVQDLYPLLLSFSMRTSLPVQGMQERLNDAIEAATTDPTLTSYKSIREIILKVLSETQSLATARAKFREERKDGMASEESLSAMREEEKNSNRAIHETLSRLLALSNKPESSGFELPQDSRFLQIIMWPRPNPLSEPPKN